MLAVGKLRPSPESGQPVVGSAPPVVKVADLDQNASLDVGRRAVVVYVRPLLWLSSKIEPPAAQMTTRTAQLDGDFAGARVCFRAAVECASAHLVVTGPAGLFRADPFWSSVLARSDALIASDVDDLFSH